MLKPDIHNCSPEWLSWQLQQPPILLILTPSCLMLCKTHASFQMHADSVASGYSQVSKRQGLLHRDLRALLRLLTHLTQRDLIDFGDEGAGAGAANGLGPDAGAGEGAGAANGVEQTVDVARLVFLGLDILIPLISLELLGYPKLCLLYFQLLAYMMEVSAAKPHKYVWSLCTPEHLKMQPCYSNSQSDHCTQCKTLGCELVVQSLCQPLDFPHNRPVSYLSVHTS